MDAKQLDEWEKLAEKATPEYQLGGTDRTPLIYHSWHIRSGQGALASDMLLVDAQFCIAARTAMPALIAEVRRLQAPGTCAWSYVDGDLADYWDTECGASFCLEDGTPADNGMLFCHHCGKLILVKETSHE